MWVWSYIWLGHWCNARIWTQSYQSEMELMLSEPGLNQDRPVHTRSPKYGGVLKREDLDKALALWIWHRSTKQSYTSRGTMLWRTYGATSASLPNLSDFQFPRWCLLRELYEEGMDGSRPALNSVVHCTCPVFNKQHRIEGWTIGDVTHLKNLLWSHAIHFEHIYSTAACTENVEYSLHIPDDIRRHSSPDN